MTTTSEGKLARFVKREMKKKGLRQRDIAGKAGGVLTKGYLSQIVGGKVSNLTIDLIVALAEGLRVQPHDVFDAAVGKPRGKPSDSESYELPDAVFVLEIMEKVIANPALMIALQNGVGLTPDKQVMLAEFATDLAAIQRSRAGKSRRKKKRS